MPTKKAAGKRAATKKAAPPTAGAITYKCAGIRDSRAGKQITAAFAKGDAKLAQEIDRGARTACGADLTAVIAAAKADGIERIAKCPKCGSKFAFRKTPPDE